jgi:hypothetical protein
MHALNSQRLRGVKRMGVKNIIVAISRDLFALGLLGTKLVGAREVNSRQIDKQCQSIQRFESNNILPGRNTLSTHIIIYRFHDTNKLV